jgi:hypothetical protein
MCCLVEPRVPASLLQERLQLRSNYLQRIYGKSVSPSKEVTGITGFDRPSAERIGEISVILEDIPVTTTAQ